MLVMRRPKAGSTAHMHAVEHRMLSARQNPELEPAYILV